MAKHNNAPFYYSISKSVLWILFLLALIATFAFARYFIEHQQHQHLVKQQLPQFEKLQQTHKLVIETSQTLDQIGQVTSANELPQLQQKLDQQTALIRQLNRASLNKALLPKSDFYQTGSIESNLQRLASNSQTNQEVRALAVEQLRTIIDKLQKETLDKEVQLEQLYQQIVNDNASDRITVNRAKAHASLTQSVNNFYQLDQLTVTVFSQLQQLSVQSSQQSFEQIATNLARIFAIFQRLDQAALITDQSLVENMTEFEQLLFTERLGVSKWRGHLRIAEPYLLAIAQQKTLLLNTLTQESQSKAELSTQRADGNSNILVDLANQHIFSQLGSYRINQQQFIQALYVALAVASLLLLLPLVSLRSKAKKFALQTLTICQQAAKQQEVDLTKASQEQQAIAELLSELQSPEHGEDEYQALVETQAKQNQQLSQHHLVSYWQTSTDNQQALQVLGWQRQPNSLITLFSQFDSHCKKDLLQALRFAKESQNTQLVELHKGQHCFFVTIEFDGTNYHGSVADISEKKALVEQIEQLEKDLNKLYLQDTHHDIAQANYVKKLATGLLLHNQQVLVAQNVSSLKVHRRLLNLVNLCDRENTIKTLAEPSHTLSLSDFAFKQQLETLVTNLILRLQSQKHEIYLKIDDKISDVVNSDVQLIEQLFSELGLTLLQEQLNSVLTLTINLSDQNPGKQLVRVQANLSMPGASKPQLQASYDSIKSLEPTDNSDQEQSTKPLVATGVQTLTQLFNALHITNVECSQQQHTIELAFDLPLATTENRINQPENLNLADKHLLLLSAPGSNQELIINAFEHSEADIENLANLDYLPQHLSVNHLEKNPIAAVILSAEFYSAGLAPVQRHIATLPKHLQPKLLVIQPFFSAPIHRHGLYSLTNMPLAADTLRSELAALLNADQAGTETGSNLIIEPSAFSMTRTGAVNSEILIAVENPNAHLSLVRLLNWFGLQVTLVTNQQMFIEQWQSGRYLLTITSFEQSPFISLSQGNLVRRAVLHLTDQQFCLLTQEEQDIANKWQVEKLPELSQVSKIHQILAPWLLQPEKVIKEAAKAPTKHSEPNKPSTAKAHSKSADSVELKDEFDDLLNDPVFDAALTDFELFSGLAAEDTLQDKNAAFNFSQFIENQGAPALAAVMIDEYLQLIADAIASLNLKLCEENSQQCQALLTEISLNAKIIAANDLKHLCADMKDAIANNKFDLAKQMLLEIQHAYTAVVDYAETI